MMPVRLFFACFILCSFAGCSALADRMANAPSPTAPAGLLHTNTPRPTRVPPTNTPRPTRAPPTNTPRPTRVPPTSRPAFSCEPKTCAAMDSCAEALHQLYVCGRSRLDGNQNGIPCESICSAAEAAQFSISAAPATDPPPSAAETAQVVGIVDGDTIDVLLNGERIRVRYIGINTPERSEACYAEATAANRRWVEGRQVELRRDASDTDRYGRLLRYIYADGVFVNRQLVADGYAEAVLYQPDDAHYSQFRALEAAAAAANRGCHPSGIFDDG